MWGGFLNLSLIYFILDSSALVPAVLLIKAYFFVSKMDCSTPVKFHIFLNRLLKTRMVQFSEYCVNLEKTFPTIGV